MNICESIILLYLLFLLITDWCDTFVSVESDSIVMMAVIILNFYFKRNHKCWQKIHKFPPKNIHFHTMFSTKKHLKNMPRVF